MRSPKSRSRSKGNRRPQQGNVINRVFDSSGPEGKVRGTPQQIIDKYLSLARDATLSNDRVAAENFQQHAEHYTRLLAEAMREQDARRERREAENPERRDRDEDEDRGNRTEAKNGQKETSGALNGASEARDNRDEETGLVETPESDGAGESPAQAGTAG